MNMSKDIKLFDKQGRLTKEAIDNAKNVSIKDYMEQEGYLLKKDGKNYYSLADHDSFKINTEKNEWYWNSRGRGGTIVNLLQDKELFNHDFRSTIIELNTKENQRLKNEYGHMLDRNKEKAPYQFPQDKMTKEEPEKAIKYLTEDRQINKDLVMKLVNKGFIRQDERNNVVYPWGKDGEIVGHNLEGTYKKENSNRYKHIDPSSDNAHGFSFQTGQGEVKNHFYFESEVDAMSYVSLNGLTDNSKYISMRGVNNEALMHRELADHAKRYDNTPNIVYAVDNDEAGKKFIDKHLFNNPIQDYKGKDIKYYVSTPPNNEGIKDWNDLLKSRNGKPFEPEERSSIWTKQAYQRIKQNEHEREI